jgi:hypothetical protein
MSGSRPSLRALLLALAASALLPACVDRTVSCGDGFRAGGIARNYQLVMRKAAHPDSPAHGVLAGQIGSTYRFRDPATEQGWVDQDPSGKWMDLCEFKCQGTRESLDAYREAINQAEKKMTPEQAAAAKTELAGFEAKYSAAVARCRKMSFKAKDKNYSRLFKQILSSASAGGCSCFGPDLSPLAENYPIGTQETYGTLAGQQDSFRSGVGARRQGAGAAGEEPLPEVAIGTGKDGAISAAALGSSSHGTRDVGGDRGDGRYGGAGGSPFGRGGAGAGGTGAGDASGAAGLLDGSARTQAALDPNAGKARDWLHNPYADDPDASYRAVGGAGSGGSAGSGGAIRSIASEGSSSLEFGAEGDADPAAMGSEDPADYFTRLGLDDNLFKTVERRYRATSVRWAMNPLRPSRLPASGGSKVPAPPATSREKSGR